MTSKQAKLFKMRLERAQLQIEMAHQDLLALYAMFTQWQADEMKKQIDLFNENQKVKK